MKELNNELNILDQDLFDMIRHDDKELVKSADKINKLQQKVDNFINYDLELNLLSMNVGLKENAKEKLFDLVQQSYSIDVGFMEIQGECPTVKDILQKDKYWPCICGELVIRK